MNSVLNTLSDYAYFYIPKNIITLYTKKLYTFWIVLEWSKAFSVSLRKLKLKLEVNDRINNPKRSRTDK